MTVMMYRSQQHGRRGQRIDTRKPESGIVLTSAVTYMGEIKDVRAHYYCASLVRTLYMTWRVPRHVFQARAPSRNPTKYRADDLYGILICEYFCWMLGDPHFFFGRSLPFLILPIILKNKKNLYVGSFNYFSYTIQIGSNWYMDTAVHDLQLQKLPV